MDIATKYGNTNMEVAILIQPCYNSAMLNSVIRESEIK